MSTTAIIILDRSGSMASAWDDTVGGLRNFVSKLDPSTRLRFVDFDEAYTLHPETEASAWRLPEGVHPRGTTALLDAVGRTLTAALAQICPGSRVSVLILTDGAENASREVERDDVVSLVARAQERGWLVSFLGANLEAFEEGGRLGVDSGTTVRYGAGKTSVAFDVAFGWVDAYVDDVAPRPISDEERIALAKD